MNFSSFVQAQTKKETEEAKEAGPKGDAQRD